jgi:hypothetical protein
MLLVLLGSAATASAQRLGDLSGPWQLFVDDYLVASKSGVIRSYHAFERYAQNPVLVPTRPYEGSIAYVYGTVLPGEGGAGYRMWYQSYAGGYGYRILYATSPDGIQWTKPDLGLVNENGSTQNNILFRRTSEDHTPQVIHTPWEPNPQRRYKLINYDYGRTPPDHTTSGYWGSYSSDGIHWTWSGEPDNPVLPDPGDVGQFNWDAHADWYIGYPKKFTTVRGFYRRCVGFSATSAFEAWPTSRMILTPDEFDDRWVTQTGQRTEFYGLSAFAYESMYIGFLWVFQITDGNNDGPIFVELVSSHDGVNWVREEEPRPPILGLGAPDSWEDGMVFTSNHPLVEGDTIKLWYGGFSSTHSQPGVPETAAIGLATLRKDGFASLDAGASPGAVTTKKLVGTQGPLRVNYSYKAVGGSLRVEVLDADGLVIPGYGRGDCDVLQGDSVDQQVTWGPLSELPAAASGICLRFVMQNASVYSFMAGPGTQVVTGRGAAIYTFEGDTGVSATDKLTTDGAQGLTFRNAVVVDNTPAHAAFGTSCVTFNGSGSTADSLEIDRSFTFGREFTLAAMVKSLDDGVTRLFGTGETACPTDLAVDYDPSGSAIPGLRCTLNGATVDSVTLSFADHAYHHLAVTYNNGAVNLYLDGNRVGSGTVPGGSLWLSTNLRVGGGQPRLTNPFPRSFDTDPVGSTAGWAGGPRFFQNTPGLVAVTNADARSAPNSLSLTGDSTPQKHYYGGWGGLRSDGVGDVTVSFDMKVNAYAGNIAVIPFIYSNALYGGDGNGGFGWPVNTNLSPGGVFSYYEDGSGPIPMISVSRADVDGQWMHYTATLHPAARTADVAVSVLTGPAAGTTGGVTGRRYQYGTATDYYGPALDDLAASGFLLDSFTPSDQILLDNLNVSAPARPSGTPGCGQQLRGYVDDIVVIGRALAAPEIAALVVRGAASLADGPSVPADFDQDADVDLSDFSRFQACFNGPNRLLAGPNCVKADLDFDNDVDLADFGMFQSCFNGPNRPPACGP